MPLSNVLSIGEPSRGDRELASAPEGLPDKHMGEPCYYAWKPMLRKGVYTHPQRGWTMPVTDRLLSTLLDSFQRMKKVGARPYVPDSHTKKEADGNNGWVVEMKVEGDTLYGLHQLIGEEARKKAARNMSSVCIKTDFRDGKGNVYPEAIEHNALCPNPVASDLGGFVMLSASAGDDGVAPVFQFSADDGGNMPLQLKDETVAKLRKALGLKDDAKPEEIEAGLVGRLDKPPADPQVATLSTENTRLKAELDAANGKIRELSAADDDAPSPDLVKERRRRVRDRIKTLVPADKSDFAKKVELALCGTAEAPDTFMLSYAADTDDDVRAMSVLDLLAEYAPIKQGQQMPAQNTRTLSREEPGESGGGDDKKAAEKEKAVEDEYRNAGKRTASGGRKKAEASK